MTTSTQTEGSGSGEPNALRAMILRECRAAGLTDVEAEGMVRELGLFLVEKIANGQIKPEQLFQKTAMLNWARFRICEAWRRKWRRIGANQSAQEQNAFAA